MTRISLSAKHARALLYIQSDRDYVMSHDATDAFDAIKAALSPRPQSSQRKRTKERRATKRTATSKVRREVAARAGSTCECGCNLALGTTLQSQPTLDHFFGIARAESVDTCWMLRWECHDQKQRNVPSAQWWFDRFIRHCAAYGYWEAQAHAKREADWRRAKRGTP